MSTVIGLSMRDMMVYKRIYLGVLMSTFMGLSRRVMLVYTVREFTWD
jgi:hypothetical protein